MPTKKESLGSVLREESRRLEFTEWPAAGMGHKCSLLVFIRNIVFPFL